MVTTERLPEVTTISSVVMELSLAADQSMLRVATSPRSPRVNSTRPAIRTPRWVAARVTGRLITSHPSGAEWTMWPVALSLWSQAGATTQAAEPGRLLAAGGARTDWSW